MSTAKRIPVDRDIIDILRSARIEGQQLVLADQLDRKLYERTDQVIVHIGGEWVRQDKAHRFPYDVNLPEVLGRLLESGEALEYQGVNRPGWTPEREAANEALPAEAAEIIPLSQFVEEFGDGLMQAVSEQNPPIYDGSANPVWTEVMEGLKRKPFPAQQDVVQAAAKLLVDAGEDAAILNCEMGTGKVRRIGA